MADFERARIKMVENQLRANKVVDERITEAMARLPRERFVPMAKRAIAYADEDLPLGDGRALMEPMLFARLVQLAEVESEDLVLVVGAGGGYGAAVIASMASAVVALEENEDLAAGAEAVLADMAGQTDNVVVVRGPLAEGWADQAPYDVIVVEGGVEARPEGLLNQLADGGRLVVMERSAGVQRGVVYVKRGGAIGRREAFDGATPVLPGFESAPAFVF